MMSQSYTEQLKQLRARRGDSQKEMAEKLKTQNRVQQAVLKAVQDESKTVPEIAAETGLPAQEVFWWITALRKYNKVQDEGKRGDYRIYRRKREEGRRD